METKEINKFFDERASTIVGILLKRIEVLEKEKALTPSLYKSLVKEIIYEQFRVLKQLFEVIFKIGKVEFKSREKE